MKRLSWPGLIVVAGSTILSWLNTSSTTAPPIAHTRDAIEPGTTSKSALPMAASIAALHLHDWSPPARAREKTERDIFAFKRRAARLVPPAPSSGLPAAGEAVQPPPVLFRLIGFAEDTGPDGAVRTAIISGQGQLYLVKEGETVASIYRVGEILPDSVELLDSSGGPSLRLALK
jgi:hypothetical protein